MMLKKAWQHLFQNKALIVLLIIGTITWSLTMVRSGTYAPHGLDGIRFWGANGHDGVWHIALAQSITRGSWEMPTFAGNALKNYHVGFDSLLSLLHLVTGISIPTLYFQVLPPIFAFFVGLECWRFVYLWRGDKHEAWWATFFIYFGGSLGWFVSLIRNQSLGGESMFWSQQSISTLINPPFALSLIFLFAGLIYVVKLGQSEKSVWYGFAAIFALGLLINIKVYAGLLMLGGIFVASLYNLVIKKDWMLVKIFIGVCVLVAVLFIPTNLSAGSLLVFQPFWFLETLLGYSDRFSWPKLYEALMNYKLGQVWYKLIPAYLLAGLIFVIGNFWTRLMSLKYGFMKLVKSQNIDWVDIFIFTLILEGLFVPMFFLQAGTPWNTIQFFYYSLIFSGVVAGISVARLNKFILVLIVLLTIPTTIGTLTLDYLPGRPPANIRNAEVEALNFLKDQPSGIVLTYNFDEYKSQEAIANPPRPLYLYTSTAYVSAYANKPVYLEDQINLDITGYNWRLRRAKVDEFTKTIDRELAKKFLTENNIKYLYLVKNLSPNPGEQLKLGPSELNLEQIFDNQETVIYKVN